MFCPKCGSSLPEGTRFCTICGNQLDSPEASAKKFPILAVIIPVLALLAAGIVAILLQNGRSRPAPDVSSAESSSAYVESSSARSESSSEASHEISFEDSQVGPSGSSEATDSSSELGKQESSAESSGEMAQSKAAAVMELVTTDTSNYPLVTAYFRVQDAQTHASIDGLTTEDFAVEERLAGGEYVAREVKSAMQLKGSQGLNVVLAADKSDSIYDSDMVKIQQVMTSFVRKLNFDAGDKAEVLAFDSIVQQMAYFTNDPGLLVNGINNMSTDGMTALYNAIHDGVNHATLQGGARCVIAFTDGIDNQSIYTSEEVIQYALKNQVPVYIIGVGSDVDTYTLQDIADRTGGRYWFIDDLYDLEDIYNEIYASQMEIYAVEYLSDDQAEPTDARDLKVAVDSDSCEGGIEVSFTPSAAMKQREHTSRYELVIGSYTWEEASQRCQEMGGHLATITSQSENDELAAMAEEAELKYVWIGGYTSYDSDNHVFGHWVTGEEFSYENWSKDEPSRYDIGDGEPEWYLMLWTVPELGGWTWNDQRNDPVSYVATMADKMGFICEYEE